MDNHTVLQGRFLDTLKSLEASLDMAWGNVVTATNELRDAIESGEETGIDSNSFPPDILRAMDTPALRTGWIYSRLEGVSDHRDTQCKIRRALGYSG